MQESPLPSRIRKICEDLQLIVDQKKQKLDKLMDKYEEGCNDTEELDNLLYSDNINTVSKNDVIRYAKKNNIFIDPSEIKLIQQVIRYHN